MTVRCLLCQTPVVRVASIERIDSAEFRAYCPKCGAVVLMVATLLTIEQFDAEYITPAVRAMVDANSEPFAADNREETYFRLTTNPVYRGMCEDGTVTSLEVKDLTGDLPKTGE